MAVPYKGQIYAWGRKDDTEKTCQSRLRSNIELFPIDKSFVIHNIELIEISYEDDLKCFALNYDNSDADGFPVLRGLCFPLNSNTMYLYSSSLMTCSVCVNSS